MKKEYDFSMGIRGRFYKPHKVRHWLVKSEPGTYSWEKFVSEGSCVWDGVRNFEARNNLRNMKVGDLALFYHSSQGQEVVGIARVAKSSFPDPTTKDPRWLAVELVPIKPLKCPVKLAEIKRIPALKDTALVRRSRLSVMPLKNSEYDLIVRLGVQAD